MCGITLAACMFLKIIFIDGYSVPIAAAVCLTLVFTIMAAKTVGCTLPILSKKLGFDPAVMSSPLITTIVDAISLTIYFTIATKILGL